MKKDFSILGIESTCDETSAALLKGGKTLVSNVIYSQIEEHKKYHVPQLRVSTGYYQCHQWKLQAIFHFAVFKITRKQMSFQMIDADKRHIFKSS